MTARRLAAAAALVALAWSVGALGMGAAARPGSLFRAEAGAVAIHGFYDHEGLFPVSILNLSAPFAEASYEPGPATEALGSFLWDPEAAELGTIVCVLSGNQLCDLPDYPFVAHATHPSAGEQREPPTLSIGEPGAPFRARGADERAVAGPEGAEANAAVARLFAVPMSPEQAAAARALSLALDPAGDPPDPWLVSVRGAAADSGVAVSGEGAEARGLSRVRRLDLLGGLVSFEDVHGSAEALTSGDGAAEAGVSRIRIGDLRAKIGSGGIRIADETVGGEELEAVTAALNEAFREAGFRIAPGAERVRPTADGVRAEAFAFSLRFRRHVLPEELPEGTQGADVLRIPVGLATAEVAEVAPVTVGSAGDPAAPAPAPAPPAPPAGIPDAAPPAGSADAGTAAPAAAPPTTAAPVAGLVVLGVPAVAVATSTALGVLLVLGLTWLKSLEVLTE